MDFKRNYCSFLIAFIIFAILNVAYGAKRIGVDSVTIGATPVTSADKSITFPGDTSTGSIDYDVSDKDFEISGGVSTPLVTIDRQINITDSNNNTGIGKNIFESLSSGQRNNAIGWYACGSLSTGSNNLCIGKSAGQGLTTGGNNVFVGVDSGRYNVGTGGLNVGIGYLSLWGLNNGAFNNNIAIGAYAGTYNTDDNRLIIDSLNRTTEANQIISAPIYGVIDSATASQTLRFNANVTISGTTTLENTPYGTIDSTIGIDASGSIVKGSAFSTEVCILKDVKADGVHGGSATSSTWTTRTLNTLQGDCGFLTLSSNQITLSVGKYIIDASAPAGNVDRHRIALYDVTNSSYDITGSVEYAPAGYYVNTRSHLHAVKDIVTQTIFDIRHFTLTGYATLGLGVASSSGLDEVYTIVEITRIE